MIKTERTGKGPLKQHEQKQKRRHAIVLSDDDDAKAQAPADKFPEQFEAYIVRNGLPVVYSSETSIVFDRSGKFDGTLYLSRGGDVETSTASQGDKRRRRLIPHEGLNSSSAHSDRSIPPTCTMTALSCLPDNVLAAIPLPYVDLKMYARVVDFGGEFRSRKDQRRV